MAQWFMMVSVLIVTVQVGCAGGPGFDRDAMRAMFGPHAIPAAEYKSAATEAEAWAPPTPLRLALYFIEQDFPLQHMIQKAEWTSRDKDTLADSLAPLHREGAVANTFLLTDSTIRGHDVRKIREAAARYGADAVLIVKGVGAVDRSNNAYAALYVTLIGSYVAPGTVGEALFVIEGDVWDTRVERLYATQTTEGHARMTAPAMKLEDREVFGLAKKSALEALGNKVAEQLIRRNDGSPPPNNRLR